LKETITEKEEYIQKLQAAQNKIIESEKMAILGRLTGGIVHELNNPLNFISGSVVPIQNNIQEIKEELSVDQLDTLDEALEEIDELLQNIIEGSKRSTGVIHNLLTISPRKGKGEFQKVDLSKFTSKTFTLIRKALYNVEMSYTSDEEVWVYANASEINQVFINLLSNSESAVKGVDKPMVKVEVSKQSDKVKMVVEDNGKGIKEEDLPRIFEPFFTTNKESGSTGLGLYISQGIIQKHDGQLNYIPQKVGAKFEIILPLV